MRWLFLLGVIVFLELISWVVARGLFWLVKPYLPHARLAILVAVFVISHLMLVLALFGQFRWSVSYLTLLWLMVLTSALTFGVAYGLNKLGLHGNGVLVRLFAVISFLVLVGTALYNAYTPVVRHLTIQADKPVSRPITLAVASDLHLGRLFGGKQLYILADILKREQVDILLMPGDIMDDDTYVYHGEKMHTAFDNLVSSVDGNLIASLGNHDLYKQQERQAIVEAVRDGGAILLDDKTHTLTINGTPITIIGRFDDHHHTRKSTAELMTDVDTSHLVILLDHRPSQIDDNVKLPIDLQVSGHTHNGQIFPANFIVKLLNRVAYGHELINGTHVVVSSGYGFWGVPARLGSQSEVWVIRVLGKMS